MENWIKLHRKTIKWEWFTDVNTSHLFFYCIIRANHENAKWRGIDIPRGAFITSLSTLSLETGLSIQSIRTSLKKLESTNELTSESTNNYRLISVVNYKNYQGSNKPANKQLTNDQQSANKLLTTDKNEKKNKNEKNNTYTESFESFWKLYGSIGNKNKAFEKFKKLEKEIGYEEIIRHHDRYDGYCQSTRDWYHKQHAATWLHSGWSSEWKVDNKPKHQPAKSSRQQWLESRGLA